MGGGGVITGTYARSITDDNFEGHFKGMKAQKGYLSLYAIDHDLLSLL